MIYKTIAFLISCFVYW